MKIPFRSKDRDQGSILVLTLILVIIMGMTLGSYLVLASGQHSSVARAQRWNSAIDVAEAGVEEALAQVNASPGDFTANGWTTSGNQYAPSQQQNLVNGSYSVVVVGASTPTIYSTGYVSAPITGNLIKRTVRVTTQVLPLFNVALGAVSDINMNGNSLATDSWNSHDTNLSNNGSFDPNRTSTNGDVASEQGIVNIGQHTIDGNLYLGPTATYTSGTNQVLGEIDKAYNVSFPDVTLPAGALSPSPFTNTNGIIYLTQSDTTYAIGNANNNQPIVVLPGLTNVTLIANVQNFNPTSITLQGGTTNAAYLTIYDNPPGPGGSVKLTGNSTGGAIGATPVNFIFYGMPNLTSIKLAGTTDFLGAIYAPEAALTLGGGGNAPGLEGAAIVKDVALNGHYDVHYDESLAKFGPAKGYVASSWQEL